MGIGSELLRCRRQLCAAPAIAVQATCKTVTNLLHCPTILEVVCTPRQDERLQIFISYNRRAGLASIYDSGLRAALCRWQRAGVTVHLGTCGIASSAAPRRWGKKASRFRVPSSAAHSRLSFGLVMGRQSMRGVVTQTDQAAAMERARELSHHVASPEGLKRMPATGLEPLTAKLISLNEAVYRQR